MGYFEPKTVAQLANLVEDVYLAVEAERGTVINATLKDDIAAYIVQSYEAGPTDPLMLKEQALRMARSLLVRDNAGHLASVQLPRRLRRRERN